MKVSELRGKINQVSNGDQALLELSEALSRFDSMRMNDFFLLLKSSKTSVRSPKRRSQATGTTSTSIDEAVSRLRSLKTDAEAFEAELDRVGKTRSFTKKKLQLLYDSIFDSKSNLPDKLSKSEMIARIKRQRRRDANFASA